MFSKFFKLYKKKVEICYKFKIQRSLVFRYLNIFFDFRSGTQFEKKKKKIKSYLCLSYTIHIQIWSLVGQCVYYKIASYTGRIKISAFKIFHKKLKYKKKNVMNVI